MKPSPSLALATLLAAAAVPSLAAAAEPGTASEAQALGELRNTVVNLLQGLVERGVLTREQAQQMVRAAQQKAAADVAAEAKVAEDESNAVRVPYVPEIVKEEIRRQVAADLGDEVTKNVIDNAHSEGWGIAGSMPDWVRRVRLTGDVRVRAQGDFFANDNVTNAYVDFMNVNDKGGIGRAGAGAFINTTEERERLRARLRFGFEANLGYGWSLGARIASGNLRDPVSTNQTLGNMGARYQTGVDLAYVEWAGATDTVRHSADVLAGRIRNPFVSSDLVFDQDLTFEGIAASYRLGLMRDDHFSHYAYVTLGAFPLQEVELAADKWLVGGQLGIDWKFSGGSRARAGAAIYDFRNVSGVRNTFETNLTDYTAPLWMQRGNTLFDIRNDDDSNTNLFALAGEYRVVELTAGFDWRVASAYRVSISGSAVRNVGFDAADVRSRANLVVDERVDGYQGEIGFGSVNMAQRHAWRASFGYRYLQRDAVLDAFTDSDFRLGGTDVKGYFISGEWSFTPRVSARLRYLSGSEIDGPPLGIDVLQIDLNASF